MDYLGIIKIKSQVNSIPPFIQHYIEQYISEDCVIALNQLAREYAAEEKKINSPERHEGDRRYKQLTGDESPRSVKNELKRLDDKYKSLAKDIAHTEAEKEGIELKDYNEPEIKKSTQEKSEETEKNIASIQDKLINKQEELKVSFEIKKEEKSEVQETKQELTEQFAENKDLIQSPQVEQNNQSEKSAKDLDRAKKIEEIKKQFEENRELYKDRRP